MCGFKKSVSACAFCRVDKGHADSTYPTPISFLADNGDLKCDECLRDQEQLDNDHATFQTLQSDAQRDDFLASIGMNSFSHAFTRVPHFDICRNVPYDFMHCELEGSCKNELAAMLFYLLSPKAALVGVHAREAE